MKKIVFIIIALIVESSIHASETPSTCSNITTDDLFVITHATRNNNNEIDMKISIKHSYYHDFKMIQDNISDDFYYDNQAGQDGNIEIARGILSSFYKDFVNDEQNVQESDEIFLAETTNSHDNAQLMTPLNESIDTDISKLIDQAMFTNKLDALNLLLDQLPHLNHHIDYGQTLMHKAIFRNHIPSLSFLMSKGANVNAQDTYGYTLLQSAVKNNNIAAVTLLLAHGADTSIKDTFGLTALEYEQTENMKNLLTTMNNAPGIKSLNSKSTAPAIGFFFN